MATGSITLPLWAAVFGTLYQLTILIFGIVKFQDFISFCRGANYSGRYEWVKNALLLSLFSYAPLVAISITFMWVSFDKDWSAGAVFVMLPVLSVLLFVLVLLGTVNDISNALDNNRKGRKRLPIQAPPHLVVANANMNDINAVATPTRVGPYSGGDVDLNSPALPIQQEELRY